MEASQPTPPTCSPNPPLPVHAQAARLTYPPFTLAMVVLLLDGANFGAAALMTPSSSEPGAAAAAARGALQRSMLLRFGVAAGWFLVLGIAQWLWKAVIVHRFFGHPLSNFVDLLFLANTSAVVLDDRSGGYYLHGRNQMHHAGGLDRLAGGDGGGHHLNCTRGGVECRLTVLPCCAAPFNADTTLSELNASLLREEEGLVSKRGLVTTYTGGGGALGGSAQLNDNQTFTLHITDVSSILKSCLSSSGGVGWVGVGTTRVHVTHH